MSMLTVPMLRFMSSEFRVDIDMLRDDSSVFGCSFVVTLCIVQFRNVFVIRDNQVLLVHSVVMDELSPLIFYIVIIVV